MSYDEIKSQQDEFLQLAEQFQEKINQVILPVRLGIYTLYSVKKVAIFNKSILKMLDYYIK